MQHQSLWSLNGTWGGSLALGFNRALSKPIHWWHYWSQHLNSLSALWPCWRHSWRHSWRCRRSCLWTKNGCLNWKPWHPAKTTDLPLINCVWIDLSSLMASAEMIDPLLSWLLEAASWWEQVNKQTNKHHQLNHWTTRDKKMLWKSSFNFTLSPHCSCFQDTLVLWRFKRQWHLTTFLLIVHLYNMLGIV